MASLPWTKQLADLLTLARASLPLVYIWLGLSRGAEGLSAAVYLQIASWTSDAVDGVLARQSGRAIHTWIGDHDLEVDMAVSAGLLVYLVLAGLAPWSAAVLYVLVWLAVFWRFGLARSLGMFVQAPIYAFFLWRALVLAPVHGRWLVAWIVAAIAITWPRFPRQVVPSFLKGIRSILESGRPHRP